MRTLLANRPKRRHRLKEVQATLCEEQSRFRTFVRALEHVGEPAKGISHLPLHFDLLVAHLKGQWPIDNVATLRPRGCTASALDHVSLDQGSNRCGRGVCTRADAKSITASAKIQDEIVAIDLEHDGAVNQMADCR